MPRSVLPRAITVCGRSYRLNTDFRSWIELQAILESPDLTGWEKARLSLLHVYGCCPADAEEAYKQMGWFYSCGEERRGEPAKERLIDWERDYSAIWADFKLYCHIDLDRVKMHWWRFYALFRSLPKDAEIKRRISIRAIDLSKIKDNETREDYRKMKDAVALDYGGEEDLQSFYERIGR